MNSVLKIFKITKLVFILIISNQITSLQAVENSQEEVELNKSEVGRILLEDPSFKLRIRKSGAPIIVNLNGVRIFKETSTDQVWLYYPVNSAMTSGSNEISFDLMAFEDMDYQLGKDSYASVSLVLEVPNEEEQIISTLSYDTREKDRFTGSSVAGNYSSLEHFKADDNGDVSISELVEKPMEYYISNKVSGVRIEHVVNLSTPFPRWKFLDSDLIMDEEFDYNALSDDEYEELKQTPLIQSLYDEYIKIQMGLERKDVASIIGLFDERNQELAVALGSSAVEIKENLTEALTESVANDTLVPFTASKRAFYIEKGNRMAYVSPIAFNYGDGGGSDKYNMKFRLENGKWILTR